MDSSPSSSHNQANAPSSTDPYASVTYVGGSVGGGVGGSLSQSPSGISPSGVSVEELGLQRDLADVRSERDSLFSGEIEGEKDAPAQSPGQSVTENRTRNGTEEALRADLVRERQEKETMRAELLALRASAANSTRAEELAKASSDREKQWERVAEAISPSKGQGGDGEEGEGKEGEGGKDSENKRLRAELRSALEEAKRADEQHAKYQAETQTEFDSLWVAVQVSSWHVCMCMSFSVLQPTFSTIPSTNLLTMTYIPFYSMSYDPTHPHTHRS